MRDIYAMASSPSSSRSVNNIPEFSQKQMILGGVAISVVLINLLALIFCCCFKRGFSSFISKPWGRKGKLQQGKIGNLRRFQMIELEKATNNFNKECMVGSGAFGNVYRGLIDGKSPIAIKRPLAISQLSVQEFRNEVELISKVKHNNLVALVGFCDESGQKILVYEYIPNGSLLDYIVGRKGRTLTWRQRVQIAIGAAKGITHLHHGVKPSIIHRDIKPSNILVGEGFEAKVSDFGLVRSGPLDDASYVSSQIKGTPGYLDPAYCTSLHLTLFTDVFSFGVILLQLVTGRPAVDSSRSTSSDRYHIVDWARPSLEQGKVEEIIDANLLMEPCNMEVMLKMGLLGLRCVEEMPKQRPTMARVHQELEDALKLVDDQITLMDVKGEDHSYVSVDEVKLQKFYVDVDSISLQSASLRKFDIKSFSIDHVDKIIDV